MLHAKKFPEPMHILHVYSHNIQGNVIISRTQNGMLETFKACYGRNEDSKPTAYYVGNLVDLPASYVAKMRKKVWDVSLQNFKTSHASNLAEYLDMFGRFLPHTAPCDCWPKDTKGKKFSDVIFSYSDRRHKKCSGLSFVLTNSNWEDSFKKTNPDWDKNVPPASLTKTKEKILIATGPGLFSYGSGAKIQALPELKSFHFDDQVMFAFTGEPKPVPVEISSWINYQRDFVQRYQAKRTADFKKSRRVDLINRQMKTGQVLGYSEEEAKAIREELESREL